MKSCAKLFDEETIQLTFFRRMACKVHAYLLITKNEDHVERESGFEI